MRKSHAHTQTRKCQYAFKVKARPCSIHNRDGWFPLGVSLSFPWELAYIKSLYFVYSERGGWPQGCLWWLLPEFAFVFSTLLITSWLKHYWSCRRIPRRWKHTCLNKIFMKKPLKCHWSKCKFNLLNCASICHSFPSQTLQFLIAININF